MSAALRSLWNLCVDKSAELSTPVDDTPTTYGVGLGRVPAYIVMMRVRTFSCPALRKKADPGDTGSANEFETRLGHASQAYRPVPLSAVLELGSSSRVQERSKHEQRTTRADHYSASTHSHRDQAGPHPLTRTGARMPAVSGHPGRHMRDELNREVRSGDSAKVRSKRQVCVEGSGCSVAHESGHGAGRGFDRQRPSGRSLGGHRAIRSGS